MGVSTDAPNEADTPPEPKTPNSWQLCSIARNVDSTIPSIASSTENLVMKVGTEYTAHTGFRYTAAGASAETDVVGEEIKFTILESGSGAVMNTVAAIATALMALYAF